jgi:hypothetical protein
VRSFEHDRHCQTAKQEVIDLDQKARQIERQTVIRVIRECLGIAHAVGLEDPPLDPIGAVIAALDEKLARAEAQPLGATSHPERESGCLAILSEEHMMPITIKPQTASHRPDASSIRRACVNHNLDPRTLRKAINGLSVKGMAGERAREALRELGLTPSQE